MAAKGNKLEASLVSMTGTLIYLNDMEKTLKRKPLVPRSVESLMAPTQVELEALSKQFQATREAAVKDAQPLLDEWLRKMGLSVGGCISGCTWRHLAGRHGSTLTFEGGIEHARLHRYALSGTRVVDFTLVGARLGLPSGSFVRTVEDIPVRNQADFNFCALSDVQTLDARTGETVRVLHVYVPLQEDQRERWARLGDLELT
ncbi:hypothetical protein [Burkholderia ubonensis]|nr:hypothetical protein [Burkholderia ubonensis]